MFQIISVICAVSVSPGDCIPDHGARVVRLPPKVDSYLSSPFQSEARGEPS
jgi:hypothetical protein